MRCPSWVDGNPHVSHWAVNAFEPETLLHCLLRNLFWYLNYSVCIFFSSIFSMLVLSFFCHCWKARQWLELEGQLCPFPCFLFKSYFWSSKKTVKSDFTWFSGLCPLDWHLDVWFSEGGLIVLIMGSCLITVCSVDVGVYLCWCLVQWSDTTDFR